jgi:Leucine-rich repeat (LRR) protein
MAFWPSHLAFLAFFLAISQNFGCEQGNLPNSLSHLCHCNMTQLSCKNLNSSEVFVLKGKSLNDISSFGEEVQNPFEFITALQIQDSNLNCLNADHFKAFASLKGLTVVQSGLGAFLCQGNTVLTAGLESLNLSRNKLKTLTSESIEGLIKLRVLIVSYNEISRLPSRIFASLQRLEVLDLSNNRLDEDLKASVFKSLPSSINQLDISSKSIL